MSRRAAALAILLLLAPALPAPPPLSVVGSAQGANPLPRDVRDYPWWNAAQCADSLSPTCWHMRVAVVLQPRIQDRVNGGVADIAGDRIRNYPAAVEIDFTQAILQAGPEGFGWPRDGQGSLTSFTFDVNSVRVVEHSYFQGCILIRYRTTGAIDCGSQSDRSIPEDDFVLPSTFSPGLWLNTSAPAFDAKRNAVGTVQWVVRGVFDAPRAYFVYFDILENTPKAAPSYDPQATGTLDGLHFIRSGTDVLGFAPGSQFSGPGVLMAQALYDNTTISILKYVSRGVQPAEMVRGTVNALTNTRNAQAGTCPGSSYGNPDYRGTVCLDVPQGERFFFRVQANRPVVVGMRILGQPGQQETRGPTWYPSQDGGLAGNTFNFRALGSGANAPMYLVSPSGQAFVNVNSDAGGSSFVTVDGFQAITTTAGRSYTLSSSRPILALQSSPNNRYISNYVSGQGAPTGAHLFGWLYYDLALANAGERDTQLRLASPVGDPDNQHRQADVPLPAGPEHSIYFLRCSCGSLGEVWRLDARDETPMWAKSGEQGIAPLGGKDGMRFRLSLQPEHPPTLTRDNDPAQTRLILMGLYDNTRVSIVNADTGRSVNTTLDLHTWVDQTDTGAPIGYGNWRIDSSKPIAAYFFAPGRVVDVPYSTYYVAKVEPPLASLGPGEFHGFAVGWAEKVKTAAVGPGERVRLKLTLVNLGRGINAAPLADDIGISKPDRIPVSPPNATQPSVDLSSVLEQGVPSFQSRDITLSITVPAEAATGTVYQVNVTAASRGNPNFKDVARVVVTVQIRYEFAMRFLETNSTQVQKIIKPDSATCIDLELRNTGTGDVSVRLQMTPTKKSPAAVGFDPRLLERVAGPCALGAEPLVDEDGQPTHPVQLARGEARVVTLYVKAPADTRPLPLELEVQGTAEQDASVRQQASAVIFTNVEAKVRLTALNETELILPRSNATFRMRIENVGDVETPIEYSTTGSLPLGWGLDFVGAPPLLRGRGASDAAGQPLDRAEFEVNVSAAPDAPVALVVPLSVVATSSIIVDTGETSRAFRQSDSAKLTAIVGNNFTLEQAEALPLTINPGEPFGVAFELRNIANGNFTLQVAPGTLPRNWTLHVVQPENATQLGVGDRVQVRLNVTPELATKAGAYEVGVVFLTRDPFTQGAQFRNLSVLVRSTVEFRVEPDVPEVVMAPGGQRELTLRVVNSGNLPVVLHLTASPPGGYQASFPASTRAALAPGEATTVTLLLRAPPSSAETAQPLRIVGVDDTSNKQKEFQVMVQTASLDLLVTEAVLPNKNLKPGDAAVVVVSLQNRGTIPANNVAVALLVNGRSVRNETVRTVPPGEPRTITIPWTVDEVPRDIVVLVDADDKYSETDETNNQARVDLGRGTPGPGLAGLAAAAGLALALARAARLKPPRRGGGPDG